MTWKQVSLDDDDVANHRRLQEQFEAVFSAARAPNGAAMFSRDVPHQRTFIFYFSPQAATIFSAGLPQWEPIDCSAPDRDSVALVVGNAGARDMLAESKEK